MDATPVKRRDSTIAAKAYLARAGLLVALLVTASPARSANGDILSREPFRPTLGYGDWFARAFAPSDEPLDPKPDLARARAYYTPTLYRALIRQHDVIAERITYESDGLRIAGLVVRPRRPIGRLPVILWCRGGIGAIGGITLGDVLVMSNWARAGYVVIATNYRGGPRSGGHDEDGGADVDDATALVPLASALPYADIRNLFLYGQSRGGMMVYRALAEGVPAKAAAVNSGVTDISRNDRPDAADMDALARAAMPDYAIEVANHFCRRSVICWPDKINAPLLLLHGTADWRVPAAQVIDFAARLQAFGKPYELHMVERGTHVWLDQDQAAIDRAVLAFFKAHAAS